MAGLDSMLSTEEQFDDTADDLRLWLRERVLTQENLENKTDDEATYLLHPDPTCRALPQEGDPAGTVPSLNQGCVDDLTRLAVRVVMRADGDGGRLKILIGPDRIELSQFVIHSDLLAVEVDLPKAYAATQVIDQTLGSDSPTPTRFEALAGRIRLAVHKDGEKKVTGSAAVLQAINIATLESDGTPGPVVKLAASDPTFAVTADGVAETLTLATDLGALEVFAPWDPSGAGLHNRDLHVTVGGAYGTATFTEASDKVVATGVGVGPTTIDAHGTRLFELGLNPNDARRFDVTVSLDDAGQPQLELQPRFDLSFGLHFGAVAGEFMDPPPSYVLNESYGVKLDNGGAPARLAGVPSSATFNGGVKVSAGTLTISSTGAPSPVIVPAGRCLTGLSEAPSGTHPILGALSVVDCPSP
jgi:hypothetical protein